VLGDDVVYREPRPPSAYPAGRLCKGCVTAELLQPEELVSGIICQVAAEPELAELLSSFVYTGAGAAYLQS